MVLWLDRQDDVRGGGGGGTVEITTCGETAVSGAVIGSGERAGVITAVEGSEGVLGEIQDKSVEAAV